MPIDINKLHKRPEVDFSDLTFGDRLKAVRKARGLTCQALADKAGIGSSTISFYEKRGVLPNVSTLELMCKALGVSASTLLGF